MKKVLFLINNLNRGGAERTFVRQANELHRQGVVVHMALLFKTSPDGYTEELKLPPAQVHLLRPDGSKISQVRRLVYEHDIDVLYSTLELPNIIARVVTLITPGLSLVVREGSATLSRRGRVSPKPIKFRIFDITMNWTADTIVAVSDEIAQALRAYQPMYAHKIVVVENGVPVEEELETVKVRAEQKLTHQEFRILSAASMNYRERAFEYLIDALPLLPPELLQRTMLTFAGEGTFRPQYEAQVTKLGLAPHVRFLGRIGTPALQEEYLAADVFVVCSTAEGSPNVIIEAMSYGVPAVTTRVGSAVSMVRDQETGFFVPFNDSQAIANRLGWLASHPQERLAMGLASYRHVQEKYSFERNLAQLKKVLGVQTFTLKAE